MTNIYGILSRVIKYSADTFKSALTSSSNHQTAKGDSNLVPDTKPPWATTQPATSLACQWVMFRRKGVKRKQNRRSNIQKPSVLISTELSACPYGTCHQALMWLEKVPHGQAAGVNDKADSWHLRRSPLSAQWGIETPGPPSPGLLSVTWDWNGSHRAILRPIRQAQEWHRTQMGSMVRPWEGKGVWLHFQWDTGTPSLQHFFFLFQVQSVIGVQKAPKTETLWNFFSFPSSVFFFLQLRKTVRTNLFLMAQIMIDFQTPPLPSLFRWPHFCMFWMVTSRKDLGNSWYRLN